MRRDDDHRAAELWLAVATEGEHAGGEAHEQAAEERPHDEGANSGHDGDPAADGAGPP